jgi:enoyl-CoA hydratase/carnithine racemase
MAYSTILFDVDDGGVATITLNRPARMNAFTREMAVELAEVWGQIREDEAIRAVVLRAAGEKAFSTGVDTSEDFVTEKGRRNPLWRHDPSDMLCPKPNKVWKPVICAVHGVAAGGAFYWINDADIVICSDDAHFFDPHVSVGMVAASEPIGLIGRIGYGEVLRMALMGNDERVSAATALRIGLVTEVVPRETLWPRADEIARIIAGRPPIAVQGTVRAIWEALEMPRGIGISNGLKYTQLGNPIGKAQVDPAATRPKWTLR